ncbi:MAG: ABC transporter permease [Deltaproteobacteria bacterium]|nr:ABC transporter permease [Deltaproteobacteria bacterium]
MRLRNVYHLSVKEFLHMIRDRRTLVFLLLMPTVLTVVFASAVGNSKVTGIKMRVVDLDHGKIAEEYLKDIGAAETFALEIKANATEADLTQAEEDLDRDKIKAIVVLPKDLTTNLMDGAGGEVKAIVDGSDTFAAPAVLRELGGVAVRHNMKLAAGFLLYEGIVKSEQQAKLRVAPVDLKIDVRYNPELKAQNFTMPGVIGLILQLLTVIVMATSIARERERGTFEQLSVTPLKGAEIFIGKLVPYFILSLIDTVNVMIVARVLFGVSLSGHYGVVTALVVVFVLGSLGIGQLISVVSKNQAQAVQLAIFYTMPVFVLSGAFAPLETLPGNVRPIAYLFPLTYFCRSFRAALLRQATFSDVGFDLLAMFAFAVLTFGLSVLLLRRQPTSR